MPAFRVLHQMYRLRLCGDRTDERPKPGGMPTGAVALATDSDYGGNIMTKDTYESPEIASEILEPETLLVAGSPTGPSLPGQPNVTCKPAPFDF